MNINLNDFNELVEKVFQSTVSFNGKIVNNNGKIDLTISFDTGCCGVTPDSGDVNTDTSGETNVLAAPDNTDNAEDTFVNVDITSAATQELQPIAAEFGCEPENVACDDGVDNIDDATNGIDNTEFIALSPTIVTGHVTPIMFSSSLNIPFTYNESNNESIFYVTNGFTVSNGRAIFRVNVEDNFYYITLDAINHDSGESDINNISPDSVYVKMSLRNLRNNAVEDVIVKLENGSSQRFEFGSNVPSTWVK